jgi:hypothetical protein
MELVVGVDEEGALGGEEGEDSVDEFGKVDMVYDGDGGVEEIVVFDFRVDKGVQS